MPRTSKPGMQSWGDLNAVLNGLTREGVIAGFRTNRKERAEPVIWVKPSEGEDAGAAIDAVRGKLTGVFVDAGLRLDAGS